VALIDLAQLSLTELAAALDDRALCARCRMRLEAEQLARRQALDLDDDGDEAC
jgi:hypothetical protein